MPVRLVLLILLISLGHKTFAETIRLPETLVNADDMVNAFRGSFETKIQDLAKNYITTLAPGQILYTSHQKITCQDTPRQAGTILAKIQHKFSQSNQSLSETVSYYGCGGNQIDFKEIIITEGENLVPPSILDIKSGSRKLGLKTNETKRIYSLKDKDDIELIRITLSKTESGMNETYHILGKNFLTLIYEYTDDYSRLNCIFKGMDLRYNLTESATITTRWGFSLLRYSVIAYKKPAGKILFLDDTNTQISEANYQSDFSLFTLQSAMGFLANIIKHKLQTQFPETSVLANIGANQRILDELQLAYTRLLTNTDLTLVKQLVQEYKDAIENGLIDVKDKRPAK